MKQSNEKWVLGHKVSPHFTSGDYDLITGETPPQVPGPPPHFHHTYHESFVITEGEMEFMMDGEIKVVKAGETINIPPKTLHTFSNKSDHPCKWVNLHSPKGFIKFFSRIGIPIKEEQAQKRSVDPAIIDEVINTASDFDMHIDL